MVVIQKAPASYYSNIRLENLNNFPSRQTKIRDFTISTIFCASVTVIAPLQQLDSYSERGKNCNLKLSKKNFLAISFITHCTFNPIRINSSKLEDTNLFQERNEFDLTDAI